MVVSEEIKKRAHLDTNPVRPGERRHGQEHGPAAYAQSLIRLFDEMLPPECGRICELSAPVHVRVRGSEGEPIASSAWVSDGALVSLMRRRKSGNLRQRTEQRARTVPHDLNADADQEERG